MLGLLAQASEAQPNPLAPFLFLVPMGVIFYFLLIRPQNQRRRSQLQMQSELEVGDDVVTTAGIYGTVTEIDDDYGIVTIEVAPGMEVRFARAAIAQRLLDDEEMQDVDDAEPGA
jgi:preprotein translocase subunit YajC